MKNASQDFMHPSVLFLENEPIVLMGGNGNYDKSRQNESTTTKSKSLENSSDNKNIINEDAY